MNKFNKIAIIQPFRKPKFKEMIVKNYPNMEVVNTAPLQLASLLKNEGYGIKFISLQNSFRSYEENDYNRLLEIIDDIKADLYIFHTDYYMSNTNTASLFSIKLISKIIKEKNKDIPIILTGKLVENLRGKLFELLPNIDYAIKGEGEDVILSLLKEITTIEEGVISRLKTRAILYKRNQEVLENDGVALVSNYNVLPIIDYSMLDYTIKITEKSLGKEIPNLPISIRTSYGCPFKCNFCGGTKNWNNYRMKTSEVIRCELEIIKRSCSGKLKIVFLADELFTYNREHVQQISIAFKGHGIKVSGLFGHVKYFDIERARDIKEMSDTILFGAENCDSNVLVKANKNISFENVLHATKIAKRCDLAVGLEWIVGLPGETIDTVIKNINLMYTLVMNKTVDFIEPYILCIHPDTEYDIRSEMYGIKSKGNYEHMLEEGGYPQYELDNLSSNQIFVYYLLASLMINEALRTKKFIDYNIESSCINISEFRKLFKMIN